MADKEEVKIPDLDKDPIYKEEVYSRQSGSVIMFTNIDNPEDVLLSGKAVLQAQTPQGLMPVPYNFEFTKEIKDYK